MRISLAIVAGLWLGVCAAVAQPEDALTPQEMVMAAGPLLHTDRHDEGVALIEDAVALLLNEIAEEPNTPLVAFELGAAYQILDRLDDAVTWFEFAVELAPDTGTYRYALAMALQAAGRDAEAIVHLEWAVELEPDNPQPATSLAFALEATDPDRAAALYRSVGAMEPPQVEELFGAATGLRRLGHEADAAALDEKIVATGADSELGHRVKAVLLLGRGAVAEAAAEYEAWMALQPDNHEPMIRLMEMRDRLGDRAGRDAVRDKLYALRESGRNPELSEMDSYVRQRMNAQDHFVIAEEWFELGGEMGDAKVAFTLYEYETGEPVARVSIGSYDTTVQAMREAGQIGPDERIYHVDCYKPGRTHETYGFYNRVLPYEQMMSMAIQIFNGQLKPTSATRIGNGKMVIEQEGRVVQEVDLPPGAEDAVPKWVEWKRWEGDL